MTHSPEQTESLSHYGKLLVALAKGAVDFAVVDGLAVIFNGYPRFTLDADVIVDDSPRGWGEGWARELSIEDFPPEEGAVRLVEDFELDIFTRLRGRALRDFKNDLRHLEYAGARIPYLSPAGLIHCKEDSVREKDQLDIAAMKDIASRSSKP